MSLPEKDLEGSEHPLLPIQARFFSEDAGERHHWNQAVLLMPQSRLDWDIVGRAVAAVVAHHDALASSFRGDRWRLAGDLWRRACGFGTAVDSERRSRCSRGDGAGVCGPGQPVVGRTAVARGRHGSRRRQPAAPDIGAPSRHRRRVVARAAGRFRGGLRTVCSRARRRSRWRQGASPTRPGARGCRLMAAPTNWLPSCPIGSNGKSRRRSALRRRSWRRRSGCRGRGNPARIRCGIDRRGCSRKRRRPTGPRSTICCWRHWRGRYRAGAELRMSLSSSKGTAARISSRVRRFPARWAGSPPLFPCACRPAPATTLR